jgi:hypothetical protein
MLRAREGDMEPGAAMAGGMGILVGLSQMQRGTDNLGASGSSFTRGDEAVMTRVEKVCVFLSVGLLSSLAAFFFMMAGELFRQGRWYGALLPSMFGGIMFALIWLGARRQST